ncbi:MAG: flagellin, partial [SAR324 cluster bacterium]|nr:flagellin [SAR324 cluster bacterium]
NAPTKTGWEVDIQQVATRSYVTGLKPVNLRDVEEGIELVINEGNRVVELKTKEDAELAETLQSLLQNYRLNPQVYDKAQVEAAMGTV